MKANKCSKPVVLVILSMVLLLCSAIITTTVLAADQTVNIAQSDTVAEIQTKIQAAISAAGGSGTVTVSGSKSGVDATLTLDIPVGVKVVWKADYVGAAENLIRMLGGGTFEAAGGRIENATPVGLVQAASYAIRADNGYVAVSGGTVSASGKGGRAISTDSGDVTVTGGSVTVGDGTVIDKVIGVVTNVHQESVLMGTAYKPQYASVTIMGLDGKEIRYAFTNDFRNGYNGLMNNLNNTGTWMYDGVTANFVTDASLTNAQVKAMWEAAVYGQKGEDIPVGIGLRVGSIVELVLDRDDRVERIANYAAFKDDGKVKITSHSHERIMIQGGVNSTNGIFVLPSYATVFRVTPDSSGGFDKVSIVSVASVLANDIIDVNKAVAFDMTEFYEINVLYYISAAPNVKAGEVSSIGKNSGLDGDTYFINGSWIRGDGATCTVTFYGNGGVPDRQEREVEINGYLGANMPSNPVRNNCNFVGWNTAANGSGALFTYSTVVRNNTSVYAVWQFIGGWDGGFVSDSAAICTISGNITVSGGMVSASGNFGRAIYTISGNTTVSGGTVSATGRSGCAIYCINGFIKVIGGLVDTSGDSNTTIYAECGNVAVSGGMVRASGDGGIAISTHSGDVEISNNAIVQATGDYYAINENIYGSNCAIFAEGDVTVTGGAVSSRIGTAILTLSQNTTVNVSGGSIQANGETGVAIVCGGKANISGGNISASGVSGRAIGIFNENSTITIRGGTVCGSTAIDIRNGGVAAYLTGTCSGNFVVIEGKGLIVEVASLNAGTPGTTTGLTIKAGAASARWIVGGSIEFTLDGGSGAKTLFWDTSILLPNASISPTRVAYSTASVQDTAIALTRNGTTLYSLMNGANTLRLDADYTVSGNTVTIKASYLVGLGEGEHTIIFNMSAGVNPRFTVTITNPEQPPIGGGGGGGAVASLNATISPVKADFGLNAGQDLTVTLTLNGNILRGLKHGNNLLKSGEDYAISGNTVTIKASYLAKLAAGTQIIVFDMNGGTNPQLTVTIQGASLEEAETPLAQPRGFAVFIQGFEDNTFRGDLLVTREQFVAILYRLNNLQPLPQADETNPSFKDVAVGRWSYNAIEWAKKTGLTEADAEGNFRPADPLTRTDMAVMLVKANNLTEMAEDTFNDLAGHPHRNDILKAVQAKIFTGYPNGTFNPEGSSTRNEAVTALIRYLLGGEPDDEMWQGISLTFSDVPRSAWAYKYIALAVNGM
jgi:hypothetical protein